MIIKCLHKSVSLLVTGFFTILKRVIRIIIMNNIIELLKKKSSKELKFQVIILGLIIIGVLKIYFEKNYMEIIVGFVFIMITLNYYIEEEMVNINTNNNELMIQLNT